MKLQAERSSDDENELEAVPLEARTVVTRLYQATRELGSSQKDFLSLCQAAGYLVAESSLRRWDKNVRERGEALPDRFNAGRHSILDDEEKELVAGYVFDS